MLTFAIVLAAMAFTEATDKGHGLIFWAAVFAILGVNSSRP